MKQRSTFPLSFKIFICLQFIGQVRFCCFAAIFKLCSEIHNIKLETGVCIYIHTHTIQNVRSLASNIINSEVSVSVLKLHTVPVNKKKS